MELATRPPLSALTSRHVSPLPSHSCSTSGSRRDVAISTRVKRSAFFSESESLQLRILLPRGTIPKRQMAARAEGSSGKTVTDIKAPENFVLPEPKLFTPRSDQWVALLGAAMVPLFRLGSGLFTQGYSAGFEKATGKKYSVLSLLGYRLTEKSSLVGGFPRPQKPLEIYEFEGCPFCRKVREMVTILDLDVIFFPCPTNGPNFRPRAGREGGKTRFPYLVDPNTGTAMYESDDIIKYLADKYGDGTVPLLLRLGPLTTISAGLGLIPRVYKGSRYVSAKSPSKTLELWAYESSPFCKLVREALCELELPFLYHSTGRGSPKRAQIFAEKGRFQVPYLEDPNTGIKMYESGAIVDYLYATYAIPKPKGE